MAPDTLPLLSVLVVMASVMGFVATLVQAVVDWLDG
jgi:hypothetical protein